MGEGGCCGLCSSVFRIGPRYFITALAPHRDAALSVLESCLCPDSGPIDPSFPWKCNNRMGQFCCRAGVGGWWEYGGRAVGGWWEGGGRVSQR